ncbi:MAG: hypothetical protein EB060_11275, partial [Proteobacteria bacterium]|nr:hypothetical protein [Pseudomonadota bacterium]
MFVNEVMARRKKKATIIGMVAVYLAVVGCTAKPSVIAPSKPAPVSETVRFLQGYLQKSTVEESLAWVEKTLDKEGISYQALKTRGGPVLIARLGEGANGLCLVHHADTVAANPKEWDYGNPWS